MAELITIEKTNISLIHPLRLKELLKKVGIIVEENIDSKEEILYLNKEDVKENNPIKCGGCGNILNLDNFGHLVHGSKILYCKNPSCFNHFLANKKIKMR